MNSAFVFLNGLGIVAQVNQIKINQKIFLKLFLLDTQSNFGTITHRSKAEMADRTGLCGAGLMELESRHNSTMTCPIKSREGTVKAKF